MTVLWIFPEKPGAEDIKDAKGEGVCFSWSLEASIISQGGLVGSHVLGLPLIAADFYSIKDENSYTR